MIRIFAWIAGSKLGRWIATALAFLAGVGLLAARFYSKGKASVLNKQRRKVLEDIQERRESDAGIDRLDDDDIRQRMQDHWSR